MAYNQFDQRWQRPGPPPQQHYEASYEQASRRGPEEEAYWRRGAPPAQQQSQQQHYNPHGRHGEFDSWADFQGDEWQDQALRGPNYGNPVGFAASPIYRQPPVQNRSYRYDARYHDQNFQRHGDGRGQDLGFREEKHRPAPMNFGQKPKRTFCEQHLGDD